MLLAELASHNHTVGGAVAHTAGSAYYGATDDHSQPRDNVTTNTGSATPFNVVQPFVSLNYIIKS